MIRRQLPAYSPVLPLQLAGAYVDAARSPARTLDALTEHLTDRYAAREVVLTGSGTQALQLALMECRRALGRDLVVALPAFSCYDLVTAANGADVRIAFYDIEPRSLAPERDSFRLTLDAGVGAVVVGNLYGFPLDWDWLRAECRGRGVTVIEDAAQGLGATWNGAESGSFGDLSVLSFGRGKGWNGGGGGALMRRSGKPLSPACHGLDPAAAMAGAKALLVSLAMWGVGRPALYRLPSLIPGLELGETMYHEPGPVRAMSAVSAAIAARHAMPALDALVARQARSEGWRQALTEMKTEGPALVPCDPTPGGRSGWLRFPALARDRATRDSWVADAGDLGVAPGYPLALPHLPETESLNVSGRATFRGAQRLAASLLTLPTHPRVSPQDQRRFCSIQGEVR
ncbi:MAG: DegT/DnrJ/EryC1/StrS family aminotransferase [Dehalococcoidia bacterium]